MRKIIERLKERPEHHRRRVTFATSAGFTALVFVVWASVILPSGIKSTVAKSETKRDAESPIGTLRTSVASVYEATKDLFNQVDEQSRAVDLEARYEEIKMQVESGEIQLVPSGTNGE